MISLERPWLHIKVISRGEILKDSDAISVGHEKKHIKVYEAWVNFKKWGPSSY
jgi:hypothetical protein